jgi:hypothetical protein
VIIFKINTLILFLILMTPNLVLPNNNSLGNGNPNNNNNGHASNHHNPSSYTQNSYDFFQSAGTFMQEDRAASPSASYDGDKNDFSAYFDCLWEVESLSSIVQRVKCNFNITTDGAKDNLTLLANAPLSNVRLSTMTAGMNQQSAFVLNGSPVANKTKILNIADWFPCSNPGTDFINTTTNLNSFSQGETFILEISYPRYNGQPMTYNLANPNHSLYDSLSKLISIYNHTQGDYLEHDTPSYNYGRSNRLLAPVGFAAAAEQEDFLLSLVDGADALDNNGNQICFTANSAHPNCTADRCDNNWVEECTEALQNISASGNISAHNTSSIKTFFANNKNVFERGFNPRYINPSNGAEVSINANSRMGNSNGLNSSYACVDLNSGSLSDFYNNATACNNSGGTWTLLSAFLFQYDGDYSNFDQYTDITNPACPNNNNSPTPFLLIDVTPDDDSTNAYTDLPLTFQQNGTDRVIHLYYNKDVYLNQTPNSDIKLFDYSDYLDNQNNGGTNPPVYTWSNGNYVSVDQSNSKLVQLGLTPVNGFNSLSNGTYILVFDSNQDIIAELGNISNFWTTNDYSHSGVQGSTSPDPSNPSSTQNTSDGLYTFNITGGGGGISCDPSTNVSNSNYAVTPLPGVTPLGDNVNVTCDASHDNNGNTPTVVWTCSSIDGSWSGNNCVPDTVTPPNSRPVLLTSNGTSSPYDGETNISTTPPVLLLKFEDAEGDQMETHNNPAANVTVNIVDSLGNTITGNAGWDGNDMLTMTGVTLNCGETYHYEYIQGLVNDGNLGVNAETNSSPSISFTTVACPNNPPVLLATTGNSSPYDGENNISSSVNTVTAKFSDADGDSMTYLASSARVKKFSDDSVVSNSTSFNTDTITAAVSLLCGTQYYWDIDTASISDGNGGSLSQANKTSNPKVVFTTDACPPSSSPFPTIAKANFEWGGSNHPLAASSTCSSSSNCNTTIEYQNVAMTETLTDWLYIDSGNPQSPNPLMDLYTVHEVISALGTCDQTSIGSNALNNLTVSHVGPINFIFNGSNNRYGFGNTGMQQFKNNSGPSTPQFEVHRINDNISSAYKLCVYQAVNLDSISSSVGNNTLTLLNDNNTVVSEPTSLVFCGPHSIPNSNKKTAGSISLYAGENIQSTPVVCDSGYVSSVDNDGDGFFNDQNVTINCTASGSYQQHGECVPMILNSLSPAVASGGNATSTSLDITFENSMTIISNSGAKISLYTTNGTLDNSSDDSLVESFTHSNISCIGNTCSVTPSTSLNSSTQYKVIVDNNLFKYIDTNNNNQEVIWEGLTSVTANGINIPAWYFNTGNTPSSISYTTNPTHQGTLLAPYVDPVITFSENIHVGDANFKVKIYENNVFKVNYAVSSNYADPTNKAIILGDQLVISYAWQPNGIYTIEIENGAIIDNQGLQFPGIPQGDYWFMAENVSFCGQTVVQNSNFDSSNPLPSETLSGVTQNVSCSLSSDVKLWTCGDHDNNNTTSIRWYGNACPNTPAVACSPTEVANSDYSVIGSITAYANEPDITITCDEGYQANGETLVYACDGSGNWFNISTCDYDCVYFGTCDGGNAQCSEANNCPTSNDSNLKPPAPSISILGRDKGYTEMSWMFGDTSNDPAFFCSGEKIEFGLSVSKSGTSIEDSFNIVNGTQECANEKNMYVYVYTQNCPYDSITCGFTSNPFTGFGNPHVEDSILHVGTLLKDSISNNFIFGGSGDSNTYANNLLINTIQEKLVNGEVTRFIGSLNYINLSAWTVFSSTPPSQASSLSDIYGDSNLNHSCGNTPQLISDPTSYSMTRANGDANFNTAANNSGMCGSSSVTVTNGIPDYSCSKLFSKPTSTEGGEIQWFLDPITNFDSNYPGNDSSNIDARFPQKLTGVSPSDRDWSKGKMASIYGVVNFAAVEDTTFGVLGLDGNDPNCQIFNPLSKFVVVDRYDTTDPSWNGSCPAVPQTGAAMFRTNGYRPSDYHNDLYAADRNWDHINKKHCYGTNTETTYSINCDGGATGVNNSSSSSGVDCDQYSFESMRANCECRKQCEGQTDYPGGESACISFCKLHSIPGSSSSSASSSSDPGLLYGSCSLESNTTIYQSNCWEDPNSTWHNTPYSTIKGHYNNFNQHWKTDSASNNWVGNSAFYPYDYQGGNVAYGLQSDYPSPWISPEYQNDNHMEAFTFTTPISSNVTLCIYPIVTTDRYGNDTFTRVVGGSTNPSNGPYLVGPSKKLTFEDTNPSFNSDYQDVADCALCPSSSHTATNFEPIYLGAEHIIENDLTGSADQVFCNTSNGQIDSCSVDATSNSIVQNLYELMRPDGSYYSYLDSTTTSEITSRNFGNDPESFCSNSSLVNDTASFTLNSLDMTLPSIHYDISSWCTTSACYFQSSQDPAVCRRH